MVTLKLASSLDGRIATRTGDSRWITGADARARGHLLRARHDAVMVGAASALADDPALTCRLPGMGHASPVRVVIDGSARLPAGHALIASAGEQATWIVSTAPLGHDGRHADWRETGVEVIEVAAEANGRPALTSALEALAARGLTRILVEGGGRLAASLLGARLVDRIEWFRAPGAIGADGVPALAALGVGARHGHGALRPRLLDLSGRGRAGHPGAGRLRDTPCSQGSSPTWAACGTSPTHPAAGSGWRSAPPTIPPRSRSVPPSPARDPA